MAWPNSYDTFSSPGTTLDSPPHSTLHTELSTRLAVVQQTLGLTPQGAAATVDARLDAVEIAAAGSGQWTDYSPGVSNVSTGVGSVVARYRRLQQYTCAVHLQFNFGAGSAITGTVTAQVPFSPRTGAVTSGSYSVIRSGLAPRHGALLITDDKIIKFIWAGSTSPSGCWDGTGPTTGTSGDILFAEIVYETASAL